MSETLRYKIETLPGFDPSEQLPLGVRDGYAVLCECGSIDARREGAGFVCALCLMPWAGLAFNKSASWSEVVVDLSQFDCKFV